jgi:hypothetical protein
MTASHTNRETTKATGGRTTGGRRSPRKKKPTIVDAALARELTGCA